MTRRMLSRAALLVPLSLASGCAFHLKPGQESLRQHAVFVAGSGNAVRAETKQERKESGSKGKTLSEAETDKYIANIIEGMRASGKKDVFVFAHGGLNSLSSGRDLSAELLPALDSAGYYPIFIDWDAAWHTTLSEHLFRVRQGEDKGLAVGLLTFPFIFVADVGRGVSRLPTSLYQQLYDYCQMTRRLCPIPSAQQHRRMLDSSKKIYDHEVVQQKKLVAQRQSGPSEPVPAQGPSIGVVQTGSPSTVRVARPSDVPPPAEDGEIEITMGQFEPGFWPQAGRALVGVVTFAPKLVFGPVVDGFGAGAWDSMVRRTRTMFRTDAEMRAVPREDRKYEPPKGVAARLMVALEQEIGKDTSYRTVLVGHSMGAIVAGHILRSYDLNVNRIVYMASAGSLSEIENTVVPYMQRNKTTHFYNLTLNPYADAREWQPKALDMIPRGSLLEWLDDYLTNPETRMDRRAGKWSNVIQVQQTYPSDVRGRMHIKAFGFKDKHDANSIYFAKPSKHGHFSDRDIAFWTVDMLKGGAPATPMRPANE